MQTGRRVSIGRGCRLFLDPNAKLVLGDGCTIDDQCTIAVYGNAVLEFGAGVFIGHHSTLAARESVVVGSGTFLGELVSIRDHDHSVGSPPSSAEVTVEAVVIGRDAWLGAKTTVVRGSRIGDGAVVGANAVVAGELPSRSVCVGIPARVIRRLDGAEPPSQPSPSPYRPDRSD